MTVCSNSLTSEERLLSPVTLMYYYHRMFVQVVSNSQRICSFACVP
jgi:hypothetical protein